VIYALLISMGVNVVLGTALTLLSRREPALAFTRLLGLSFLSLALIPLFFLLQQQLPAWMVPAKLGIVAMGCINLVCLLAGVRALGGRAWSNRAIVLLALGVGLLAAPLALTDLRLSQAVSALLNLGAGLLALRWLWPGGLAERIAGLTLVVIGCNQFGYTLGGESWVPVQSIIAALLRLVLGIALLYAALQRSQQRNRELGEQLQQLTEYSHQGVGVVQDGQLVYANEALLRMHGLADAQQLVTLTQEAVRREAARHQDRHQRLLDGRLAQAHWEGLRQRADGSPMHLQCSSWRIMWRDAPAEQIVLSDDTEAHLARELLLHQATHDPLTGLPNRGVLQQRLRERCAAGQPFALVWLNLDRFTQLNSAYGHGVGDQLKQALARRLGDMAGAAALSHPGEDEFALLCEEPALPGLLQALHQAMGRPLATSARELHVDASIGVALFPAVASDADGLLREAVAAMQEAKRLPGTAVHRARPGGQRSALLMQTEQALREGLALGQFELVYQPKLRAGDGSLHSFEALARWPRPGLPPVGPADFIPAAERTGLILPLGAQLLELACRQLADWRAQGLALVPVAVNVSPLQLQDAGFPVLLEQTLARHQLPAALLTLEITETAAVQDAEQASAQLARLQALGVAVALDDFGTGFSSLALLRRLPLQALKVDRSLIQPLPQPQACAVLQTICQLATTLGLEVVAEGIEDAQQAEAARAAGCQLQQGYWFARPLSAEAAAGMLSRTRKP
jgi:diguanylate cyclase (GGDEF)-like protein/PAS domain S-box-containing protein